MNELIKVIINKDNEQVISGRDLHEFLEIETPYTQWFDRILEYGFIQNVDFISLSQKSEKPLGGRPQINHALKIDMAKEIAMIQRNEKGKQARMYFIEIEKQFKNRTKLTKNDLLNPDLIILLATELKQEREEKALLQSEAKTNEPKIIFANSVSTSKTSILIRELAKLLTQNGYKTGQQRLFKQLREEGYLISRKASDYNSPTQRAMNLKLFEIKETTINRSDGNITIQKTVKVTGKGQIYFINKYLN